jgi:hypothetical protein
MYPKLKINVYFIFLNIGGLTFGITLVSCCFCPNMKQEIEEYVRKCRNCQVNNVLIANKRAPMEITIRAEHSFGK